MKKLELCNSTYKDLLVQFEIHLQTLNYSKETVYGSVSNTKEYLYFLQKKKIELNQTGTKQINAYFEILKTRPNERRDGGLSIGYLHKQRQSLQLFYKYLNLSEIYDQRPVFPVLPKAKSNPKVLTQEEVKKLFKACDDSLLGKRNKAILSLYYGCGIRRKEGVSLNVEDIDLDRNEIFIQKSKTRRQRHVPMNQATQKLIEDYLFNARELLLDKEQTQSAFLISERGNRMDAGSVDDVLQKLVEKTNYKFPQGRIGLHILRHSIATHLLDAGMKLEDIALFLGHRSLDSTQIYTHLKATI